MMEQQSTAAMPDQSQVLIKSMYNQNPNSLLSMQGATDTQHLAYQSQQRMETSHLMQHMHQQQHSSQQQPFGNPADMYLRHPPSEMGMFHSGYTMPPQQHASMPFLPQGPSMPQQQHPPFFDSMVTPNMQQAFFKHPSMMDPYEFQQSTAVEKPTKPKKRRAKTFPEKLMYALTEHEDEDAVSWLPDGKSFVIINADLFVTKVLNSVFKQAKYASFIRKLHRWGFVRLTSGTGTDCFHHPLFNRHQTNLVSQISCKQFHGRKAEEIQSPSLAGVERFIRAKALASKQKLLKQQQQQQDDDYDQKLQADDDTEPLPVNEAPSSLPPE